MSALSSDPDFPPIPNYERWRVNRCWAQNGEEQCRGDVDPDDPVGLCVDHREMFRTATNRREPSVKGST